MHGGMVGIKVNMSNPAHNSAGSIKTPRRSRRVSLSRLSRLLVRHERDSQVGVLQTSGRV